MYCNPVTVKSRYYIIVLFGANGARNKQGGSKIFENLISWGGLNKWGRRGLKNPK